MCKIGSPLLSFLLCSLCTPLQTNLLSIYHEGSKAQLIENMTAALPYMDAGLRELAERTISKVNALTDAEYKELSVYPADEV